MRYKHYTSGFALLALLFLNVSVLHAQYRDRNDRRYDDDHDYDRNGSKYDRYNNSNDRNGAYGNGDHAVPYKPEAPWMRPSPPPSKWHVWMPNEWEWRHGRYVSVPGYWMRQPNKNMRYMSGYWNRTRAGWVWRPGHWTKTRGNNRW